MKRIKIELEDDSNDVIYCKTCLSLGIKTIHDRVDACITCGNVDLGIARFSQWELIFQRQYGKKFIDGSNK